MRITISPHNPQWSHDFLMIKEELSRALQKVDYISIEHVGSTSVPLLPAKPIIDISVIVSHQNLPQAIEALTQNAGYAYMGDWGITDRHVFRKPEAQPTRNLYVCIQGSAALRNHLAVRDVCRKDAHVREEYAKVKMALARREWKDVDEYCEAKNDIVAWVLKQAGLSEEDRQGIRKLNTHPSWQAGLSEEDRWEIRKANAHTTRVFSNPESQEV